MKKAAMSHRMIEFPVSSGNAHRVKEADVKAIEDHSAKEPKPEPEKVPEPEPEKDPEPSEAAKINASNPLGVIMFGGVPEPPKELEFKKPEVPAVPVRIILEIQQIRQLSIIFQTFPHLFLTQLISHAGRRALESQLSVHISVSTDRRDDRRYQLNSQFFNNNRNCKIEEKLNFESLKL